MNASQTSTTQAPASAGEKVASHRDHYERMELLSRSLLPIAIALATGIFSCFRAQTEESRFAAAHVRDSLEAHSKQRIEVSQLVQSFVPSLTSDKPANRIMALRAIAYVDTALGNELALALTEDTSAAVRVAAANVQLAPTYPYLSTIEQVFGPSGPARIAATRQLLADPKLLADTMVVSALLDAAERHPDSSDGHFNAITILRAVPRETQQARRDPILTFTGRIPDTWTRVRARADSLADRVGSNR
ncbi:MAG TPA: hypothetical protein VF665_25055 [Longimicrobium sp.]|jgi:hypothetical protein|uniref:hypothetical protein n=1 Tax=Longimicrobium sp. TaxID=2029185 RepID=UPI002ED785FD